MELVLVIYALGAPFVFRRALISTYNNRTLVWALLSQVSALLGFHILLHGGNLSLVYPAFAALVVSSLSFRCFRCLWLATATAIGVCLWQTDALETAKTLPGDPILFIMTIIATLSCFTVLPLYVLEQVPPEMKRLQQVLLSATMSLSWILFANLLPKLNLFADFISEENRQMFLECLVLLQLTFLSTLGVEALRRYHCLKRTLAEPFVELQSYLSKKNGVNILSELTSLSVINNKNYPNNFEIIGTEAQSAHQNCQTICQDIDEICKEIDNCSSYPLERHLTETEEKNILGELPAEMLVDENYWGLILRINALLDNPSLSRNDRVTLLMRRAGLKRHFSNFFAQIANWRLAYYRYLLKILKSKPDKRPGNEVERANVEKINVKKVNVEQLLDDARKALGNTLVTFDLIDEDFSSLKDDFVELSQAYGTSGEAPPAMNAVSVGLENSET